MNDSFDLGEPDFLEPIEINPPDDPTDTMVVNITTVIGEPFGGWRVLTKEELEAMRRKAYHYAR